MQGAARSRRTNAAGGIRWQLLYHEDLQSVLPADLSKDDSLLFAEHYIRNWAEDVLLYEKAQAIFPTAMK